MPRDEADARSRSRHCRSRPPPAACAGHPRVHLGAPRRGSQACQCRAQLAVRWGLTASASAAGVPEQALSRPGPLSCIGCAAGHLPMPGCSTPVRDARGGAPPRRARPWAPRRRGPRPRQAQGPAPRQARAPPLRPARRPARRPAPRRQPTSRQSSSARARWGRPAASAARARHTLCQPPQARE